MKRHRFILLYLVCLSVPWLGGTAVAQNAGNPAGRAYVPPSLRAYRRPTYSPYLNLLRNNNTVFNYYGLVRPELEFRSTNAEFREDFRQIDRRFEVIRGKTKSSSQLGTSGHAARFMTDLRGGGGPLRQTGDDANPLPGTLVGPSGHKAYFGNNGSYFIKKRQ